MTLGEFGQAKKSDEGDEYSVWVMDHKTFDSHGPSPVVLLQSIFKWMEIFIFQMRNRLSDVDTTNAAPVFLSGSQKKMHSSRIDSCWGKVFGKDTACGGATAFRKAVVSAVNEFNQEIREDLATLMAHKKTTADTYYLLRNKEKSAVNASREVTKIMHGGSSVNSEGSKDFLGHNKKDCTRRSSSIQTSLDSYSK